MRWLELGKADVGQEPEGDDHVGPTTTRGAEQKQAFADARTANARAIRAPTGDQTAQPGCC